MMRIVKSGLGLFLFVGLLNSVSSAPGQGLVAANTQHARLATLQQTLKERGVAQKAQARAWAQQKGVPFRSELHDGKILELQRVGPNGPVFYITNNVDAADSISTDEVQPGGSTGLSLSGQGLTIGEWDSGRVLLEHPDLYDRSTQMDIDADPPPVHSDHATHVAGTLIGDGGSQYPQAMGMAPTAYLQAWDWNDDLQEMTDAAQAGLLISNHSYSIAAGWIPYGQAEPNNWWWIGGSGDEDPNFGYYDEEASALDQITNLAPYYLIVKAAGNDRWDIGPNTGEQYTIVDQNGVSTGTSTQSRPADCSQTGYDCLPGSTVAKNILTVGAVNDVTSGYSPLQGPGSVQMTGFSSFGPADDGRIKPDLVANGWLLFSTWGAPNYFAVIAGTSMAAPSVAGSLLLLQEHYEDQHGAGNFMRAATLKALSIHSADETGAANGPDYEYGWGLLNTRKAATVISEDGGGVHRIVEGSRINDPEPDLVNFSVTEDGARVRVTLVWNDPAAVPASPVLDPTASMLVNDLDLRVVGNSSVHQPWVLNPLSPASAATRGDNSRDNVEQVEFVAGAGNYTAQISNKPNLQGGAQNYSLVVSVGAPAPVSSGLLIDEHFDTGTQPPGWTVETVRGVSWDFHQDGSGDYANNTFGSAGYAMLRNAGTNWSLSSLVLPPLDLSQSESVVLRFNSHYSYLDGLETISVYTSVDGGGSWSHARSLSIANHFPTAESVDLTGKIAGAANARISFRFDSVMDNYGWNWQIDDVQVEVYGGAPPGPPPPTLDLPGQADVPEPASGATAVPLAPLLSWNAHSLAETHNIYLGTTVDLDNGDFKGNQTETEFSPVNLAGDTTYFWRVDEVNEAGTTPGVTWNFTTEAGAEPPPGPASMHVTDIDMSSEPQARNRWRALVQVRVLDEAGDAVANALVSGQWSNGAKGSESLATSSQGWVSFSKSNLKAGLDSVTFAVTEVTHATLSYDQSANSDQDGDSNGTTIVVFKDAPPPPANAAPEVIISSPMDLQVYANGSSIVLTASATDVEDENSSLEILWQVNNLDVGSGNSITHSFIDGAHTVTASVTDSGGVTGSDSIGIVVGDAPSATEVLVADLENSSSASSRKWNAVAKVSVLDNTGQSVQGAIVSGSWSAGAKGSSSCTTDELGQCDLSKGNLRLNVASVTLTITGVSAAGMSFDNSGPASIVLSL
ncbi:MAG: S8 family serine peptidase [Halioglobus sp.]